MSFLIDHTIKVSLLIFMAFGATVLLRHRSAAVRHWVLERSPSLCAAATPFLSRRGFDHSRTRCSLWPESAFMMPGFGVQHRSEWAFTFARNGRSGWAGMRIPDARTTGVAVRARH